MPRHWTALDLTKALCVLFMVFIHCAFALLTDADEMVHMDNPVFPILSHLTLLGLFPLVIPATAGAGLRLHFQGFWKGGRIEGYEFRRILKVSIAITVLGFAMNFLAWGVGEVFQWDALQFVGLSFVLMTLLARPLGAWAIYVLGLGTLLLAPWLREAFGGRENLAALLLVGGQRADGYWPFFPWFFSVAFGFGVADVKLRGPFKEGFATVVGLVGVGLVALTLSLGQFLPTLNPGHLWGPEVFQPNPWFVVGLCGFFSLLVGLSEWVADRLTFSPYGFVQSYSKGVLWIYLFHVSLADRLGEWIAPRWDLRYTVVLFPGLMALACWAVGATSVALGGKRLRVVLSRQT